MVNRMGTFILISLLIGANAAHASLSAQAAETRARLEKAIRESLNEIIGTQLDHDTYSVAVTVKVTENKPNEKPPEKPKSDKPLGMDLGVIDVQGLMESYERELAEAQEKLRTSNAKTQEQQFQVTAISVMVGLSERYPEAYRSEFSRWIADRMRMEYGSLAKTSVNVIHMAPKESADSSTPIENWYDRLLKLQNLLGLFLLAAALLLGMLWVGIGLLRVATAKKKIAVAQDGDWNLPVGTQSATPALPEGEESVTDLQRVETLPSHHDLETQIAKIAFVCMELKEKVNELVRVWLDNGDDGIVKTAILVDAIITAREKILSRAGALPPLHVPLDQEVVISHEESLAEAFRKVAQMEIEDRLPQLEKIYWDLISVRTLGLQSLRRPFDFLGGMAPTEIQNVLATQKADARALALMYVEPEVKAELIGNLSESEREQVIANVLSYNHVPQQTIWDLDTSVKVASMAASEPNKERLVNLFPRTLEVLQSLSSVDEIRILRNITPSLPDQGNALKTQFSTLAFVDSWRPEYIRKISSVATSDELTSLIRSVPQAKEAILAECAPKVRTIVQDDLNLIATVDPSITNARLDSLRAKWNRILTSERIALSRVVTQAPQAQTGGLHAA